MFMTHFLYISRNAVKCGFCKVKNVSKTVSKTIYILIPFWYNDANYSQTYYQFANDDSTSMIGDFFHSSSQTDQGKEVGIVTGFPVPYYSDIDTYPIIRNMCRRRN